MHLARGKVTSTSLARCVALTMYFSRRVAYSEDDYHRYRRDSVSDRPMDLQGLVDREQFNWVDHPPAQVAMQDLGWWENEVRWAPWDEA